MNDLGQIDTRNESYSIERVGKAHAPGDPPKIFGKRNIVGIRFRYLPPVDGIVAIDRKT
jgi:hypothetical protein